jgi:UDP-N-acetylmuramate: L-alanyl-gamma-D-glutamyl-meso-diaminopimelate ligase
MHNAVMAIAAARHAGVPPSYSIEALSQFRNVKRRMEVIGTEKGITIYDDFAHHPTAISTTLHGLRHNIERGRIIAILEPRSNTMRMGVHKDTLAHSLTEADEVILYQPTDLDWDLSEVSDKITPPTSICTTIDDIIALVLQHAESGDHVLIMSNGAFGGLHNKLLQSLQA